MPPGGGGSRVADPEPLAAEVEVGGDAAVVAQDEGDADVDEATAGDVTDETAEAPGDDAGGESAGAGSDEAASDATDAEGVGEGATPASSVEDTVASSSDANETTAAESLAADAAAGVDAATEPAAQSTDEQSSTEDAVSGFTYEVNDDGTCTVTGYTGEDADVVIPSEIGGHAVTEIGYWSFKDHTTLESVTIPEGVTTIGGNAFSGCTSLRSVNLPSTLTSIGDSAYGAFSNCTALESVVLPEGVTYIGSYTFLGCSSLVSVTLPSTLTDVGQYAFDGCSSLSSVVMSEGLVRIGAFAFQGCTSLASVALPSTLASVGVDAFLDLAQDSTIYVLDWDFYYKLNGNSIYLDVNKTTVTCVSSDPEPAFELKIWDNGDGTCAIKGYTGKEKDVVIPSEIDGLKVTSVRRNAFYNCMFLESVTLPSTVTSIEVGAFSDCPSLASVTLPEGLASIGTGAFSGCLSLADVTLPSTLTSIENGAFCGLAQDSTIYVPTWDVFYLFDGTFARIDADKTTVVCTSTDPEPAFELMVSDNGDGTCMVTGYKGHQANLVIPSEINGLKVTRIDYQVFLGANWIRTLVLPEGLTFIGSNAFSNCSSLSSVVLPSTLASTGISAFSGCTSLAFVALPEGLTSVDLGTFEGCTSLTSVSLPSTLKTIGGSGDAAVSGGGAFEGCTSLASIVLPGGLTHIGGGAFSGCSSLTSVTLPLSVTYIGADAFKGLAQGSEIRVPTWDLFFQLDGVSDYLDADRTTVTCTSTEPEPTGLQVAAYSDGVCEITGYKGRQTELTIPSEIDGNKVVAIQTAAFQGCSLLKSVTLPEGLTRIDQDAFKDCSSLTFVSLPSTVASAGDGAFCGLAQGSVIYAPTWDVAFLFDKAPGCLDADRTTVTCTSTEPEPSEVLCEFNDGGGRYTVVGYRGRASELVIPSEMDGYKIEDIQENAFSGCSFLKSITLPSTVTSVGSGAFKGLAQGSVIYVPTWDLFYLLDGASEYLDTDRTTVVCTSTDPKPEFQYWTSGDGTCTISAYRGSQASVVVPSEIDGYTVSGIASGAFKGCTFLTSVALPSTITSIGNSAFAGCTSLASISIPEGVTSVGDSAFSGCSSLASVTLPSTLTQIGDGAFLGLAQGSVIYVPTWDLFYLLDGAPVLVDIDRTTVTCTSTDPKPADPESTFELRYESEGGLLTITGYRGRKADLVIPAEIDGCEVAAIGENAFKGVTWLKSVTLPGSIQNVCDDAFRDCTSLESVTMLEGARNLRDGAFQGCTSLSSVSLPSTAGFVGKYFNQSENVFRELAQGSVIYVPTWELFTELDGVSALLDPDRTTVTCTSADPNPRSEFEIEDHGDGTCTLTSYTGHAAKVTVPSEIRGLKVTVIGESAFSDNFSSSKATLKSVTLPPTVTSIEGNCGFGGWGQVSYCGAFSNCTALESVILPEGLVSIGDGVFGGCTSLSAINLPSTLKEIGAAAFINCNSITYLNMPDGLTSIGIYAFQGCGSLESAAFPSTLQTLGYGAFLSCTSLASVKLPQGLSSIGVGMFDGCSALKHLDLPGGIASIGNSAFWGCTSLASIDLPDSLTSIGNSAFRGCSSLASVTLPASLISVDEQAFSGLAQNSVIHVPTWKLYKQLRSNKDLTMSSQTSVSYDGPAVVYGQSLTLEGEIGVNLYVAVPDSVADGASARLTGAGGDRTVPLASAKAGSNYEGVPLYKVTTQVCAKEMADDVTFHLVGANGEELPLVSANGEAIEGGSVSYSVKSYCASAQGLDARLAALATAMLNYGAASQVQFGHGDGALTGDPDSEAAQAVTVDDLASWASTGFDGSVEGVSYVGSSLTLEQDTAVSHYFSLADGRSISDYTFEVDGTRVEPERSGAYWRVRLPGVPAQDLGEFHTVTVSLAGGGSASVRYAPLTYAWCVLKQQPGTELAALCRSLYVYNVAASDYFTHRG